ncbi:hypothetical protein B296_00044234 [Ensete ventricosum]|uniref:NAC domain-containing protein n=1 Tax=Ensete ventricosum TaxID=4639 RepID=A0A426XG58_ENSVE|nr:hypothetical protein B296_00044234 [Ensete ventricosum]
MMMNGSPVFMQLDDWVLCRLYNKKNTWEKMQQQQEETSFGLTMDSLDDTRSDSFRTQESEVENDDVLPDLDDLGYPSQASTGGQALSTSRAVGLQMVEKTENEDNEWFMDLKLDDLQSSFMGFGSTPSMDATNQDYSFQSFAPPMHRPSCTNMLPF